MNITKPKTKKWRNRFIAAAVIFAILLVISYKLHLLHLILFRYLPVDNIGEYAGPMERKIAAYNPAISPARPWLDPEKSTAPLTAYQTYSAATINGAQTDYLIYLPTGYDDAANASRRYPVVYWLHGVGSEPQYGSPFVDALDAAIKSGDAPSIIAVLPNGMKNSWYVDAANGSQPVESVIIKDLIPHVDQTYRTIADRDHRAVEGFSMGAYGAAHLAMKYPQLFCAATLISAPLRSPIQVGEFPTIFAWSKEGFYAEDPVTIARRNAATLKNQVRLRIRIGERDNNLKIAIALDKLFRDWGFQCDLQTLPGIGHHDELIYERIGTKDFRFYRELFGK